jgi:hypothetical protein
VHIGSETPAPAFDARKVNELKQQQPPPYLLTEQSQSTPAHVSCPLPSALQELTLSDTFSDYDKVPELPASLTKLDITVGLVNDVTALRSLMPHLLAGLTALSLCRRLTDLCQCPKRIYLMV